MFTVTEGRQILGMGGPYVGNLYFDDQFVIDNVLLDGHFKDIPEQRLYFVRWFKNGTRAKECHFRICFFDINTERKFYYQKNFEALFLVEKVSNKLKIHRAFHNSDDRFKDEYDLSVSIPIKF